MNRNITMKHVKSFRRKQLRLADTLITPEVEVKKPSNLGNKLLLIIWIILFPPLILVLWRMLFE